MLVTLALAGQLVLSGDSLERRLFIASRDGKLSEVQRVITEMEKLVAKEVKNHAKRANAKDKTPVPELVVDHYDQEVRCYLFWARSCVRDSRAAPPVFKFEAF